MQQLAKTRTSGQGRPKGLPNHDNRDIKALIIGALEAAGGVEYLRQRAFDQPVAFMGLIGKVLPLQVTGKDGGALLVDFRWADAPQEVVSNVTNPVSTVTIINASDEPDLIEWAVTPTLAND